jgi:hypothetical protein
MKVESVVINGVKVRLDVDRESATVHVDGLVHSPVSAGSVVVGHTARGSAGSLALVIDARALAEIRRVFMVVDVQIRVIWSTGEQWLMDGSSYSAPPIIRDGAMAIMYTGRAWKPLQLSIAA